jgi:hypothetical protein
MSDYLILDPELLYRLYSHTAVDVYYSYTFLPEFTSIEVEIFYDILNTLSLCELQNIDRYLFKQWRLSKKQLVCSDVALQDRGIQLTTLDYSSVICDSKDSFNSKVKDFIRDDKPIALYTMNKLLKFLYPC